MRYFRPPLQRRLLQWLFLAFFVLLAPILIFYTSGYRYNPKKLVIERNGALIVDSRPTNARVFLDDRDTGETTPITFQNITPGWHTVRLIRQYFIPWEKRIEVKPQRVTFANNIWLWREEAPTLLAEGTFIAISTDPQGDGAILIEAEKPPVLRYFTPPRDFTSALTLNTDIPIQRLIIRWASSGASWLIGGAPTMTNAWFGSGAGIIQALPSGVYHWADQRLIGFATGTQFQVALRTGKTSRAILPTGTFAEEDTLLLRASTSTEARLLTDRFLRTHVFQLPKGQWQIGDRQAPYVLLVDGSRWLAIHPRSDTPYQGEVSGDFPRWFTNSDEPMALFLNGGEAWLWKMGFDPMLLWRQSKPLKQIAWHRSGDNIFLATEQQLFSMSLDNRDGYTTTVLATFDYIDDFSVLDRDLYVVGARDGKRGLWKMEVE